MRNFTNLSFIGKATVVGNLNYLHIFVLKGLGKILCDL